MARRSADATVRATLELDTTAAARDLNAALNAVGTNVKGTFDEILARSKLASRAFDNVGKSATQFGSVAQRTNSAANNLRFGMQNLAFQVQDVIVQLEAGVNPLRVFVQQSTQILGGFGAIATIAGAAVAALAIFIVYMLRSGDAASKAAAEMDSAGDIIDRFVIDTVEARKELKALVSDFLKLDSVARGFTLDKATVALDKAVAKFDEGREELNKTISAIAQAARIQVEATSQFGNLSGDTEELAEQGRQVEAWRERLVTLTEQFLATEIRANAFRQELSKLADERGGQRLRNLGNDLIEAQLGLNSLRLSVQEAQAEVDAFTDVVDRAVSDAPTIEIDVSELRDTQQTLFEIGDKLKEFGLSSSELLSIEKQINDMYHKHLIPLEEQAKWMDRIAVARQNALPPLDATIRFGEPPEGPAIFSGTPPPPRTSSVAADIEALGVEGRQEEIRRLRASFSEIEDARQRNIETEEKIVELLKQGALDTERGAEAASRRADFEAIVAQRVAEGSLNAEQAAETLERVERLRRQNDFNNDASLVTQKELASASVDYANAMAQAVVTTENLGKAIAAATLEFGFLLLKIALLRAAEHEGGLFAGLQALFNAGAGAAAGSAGGGTTAGARGLVFSQGKVVRSFARGDIVGSRTFVPMAEMGERGPEAVMPLTRGPNGRLGVQASGGMGGGTTNVYNIDARGSDPGTTAAAMNAAVAAAQNAMIRTFAHSTNARRAARITRAPF